MTEKRFTIGMLKYYVNDNETNYCYALELQSDAKHLCELLNELHKENQSSKEFIEQLQEELVLFKKAGADMGNDLNAQITALKQENEQLKQRNKRLEEKIQRERTSFTKTRERWSKEAEIKIKQLAEENEQLKKENAELEKFRYSIFKRMGELYEEQ